MKLLNRYYCNENNLVTAFSVEAQPRLHHEVGSRIPNSTSFEGFLNSSPLPSTQYPKPFQRAFTLIEILIVVGLFAMLMSLGAIIGFDSITRSTVHNERDLVVLMLTGARTRALANVNESAHGVRIESNQIVVYELLHGVGSELNVRTTPRNSTIISSPSNTNVVFSQLSANVTTGVGVITLSDGSKTAVIDINGQGGIEW